MSIRLQNYKHLFLVTTCILIVSLAGLSGCGTTTPAPTPAPTPEPATLGTGAVTGQVMFKDGVPAQGSIVYIFKEGRTVGSTYRNVDVDGYYRFSNLAVGSYELYATANVEQTLFGGIPHARITVSEYETTTVPTITIFRRIGIACEEEYLTTTQPSFSWEAVPTAKYYLVEVSSRADGDYEKEIQVLDTQVTWLALTPGKYSVWIEAYNEQDTLLGHGGESFSIGPRS